MLDMELELIRTYYWSGTNGKILFQGRLITYCIELPWQNNHARVSCIPEGRYELKKRWSLKFRRHLQVMNVVRRDGILIHPANDALLQCLRDNNNQIKGLSKLQIPGHVGSSAI